MKKLSLIIACVVMALAMASCTTFKATGLTYSPTTKGTVVGDFKTEVWVHQFLGYSGGTKLFNLMADQMDPAIKTAVEKAIKDKGGDVATNVTIEYQASFLNMVFNNFTAGIYAPGTVIVSGTIVKY